MAKKTSRSGILGCCVAAFVAQGFVAENALAQPRGQIFLTQVPIPKDASKAAMAKFFRKNRKTTIAKTAGESGYKMWVAARLSRKPSQAVLNLPQNAGKIHLVFYKKEKGRWKYINVMNINYTPGAVLQFSVTIPDGFGILPGKTQYQIRLTVLNAKNREMCMARTNVKFK